MRVELEPAFVVHARPYRETSLLLEALTARHGRVGLVARGARGPRSRLRGLLQPFQPLLIGWSGGGELRTLAAAEPAGPPRTLHGRALLGGLHLNALVCVALAREDPHPEVFAAYHETLDVLAREAAGAGWALRRFELRLLGALGYAPPLRRDVEGRPVEAGVLYTYEPERGPVRGRIPGVGPVIRGETLLALADGDPPPEAMAGEARRLTRALLERHLGARHRRVRELLETVARPIARRATAAAEERT